MHTIFQFKDLKGREHLKRHRHRWQNNIKMDLKRNMVWGCGLNSCGSGQGLVVVTCEHVNEPSSAVKGREFLAKLRNC